MVIPHSLQEISMDVFEDIMYVYEDWRAMNEIFAKLCKEMQEEISGHMQNLLHESSLAVRKREANLDACKEG